MTLACISNRLGVAAPTVAGEEEGDGLSDSVNDGGDCRAGPWLRPVLLNIRNAFLKKEMTKIPPTLSW